MDIGIRVAPIWPRKRKHHDDNNNVNAADNILNKGWEMKNQRGQLQYYQQQQKYIDTIRYDCLVSFSYYFLLCIHI